MNTYQTISAMVATLKSALSDGDAAAVLGHSLAGDGGGGLFRWTSASTDPENGGTIFEADEGGTGRWVRIFEKRLSPRWFGAVTGSNDQSAIEAMLGAMGGPGASGTYTAYWPYAAYFVDQVRLDLLGVTHDFDGALVVGKSSTSKKSVIDLRGGHSCYNGLRVQAAKNINYECAVHWYVSEPAPAQYAGFLDLNDIEINEAKIGLMIGALPSQATIGDRDDSLANDLAIDSPISESSVVALKTRGCVVGVHMRQPNGKLTLVTPRIHTEIQDWGDYPTPGDATALIIDNDGSELAVFGGTIEHIQGESSGQLFILNGGHLTMCGTVIESTVPAYVNGHSYLVLDQIHNFGINFTARAVAEIGPDFDGTFAISHSRIIRPATNGASGTGEVVRAVDGPGGGFQPNLRTVVNFQDVEFRDCPWRTGSTYQPLVRGVRARFQQCQLTAYASSLARTQLVRLDDGPNQLSSTVDCTFATLPTYGQTSSTSASGWNFTVSGSGSQWGKVTTGLPAIEDTDVPAWLRVTAGAGTFFCYAESEPCPLQAGKAHIVRGYIKTGNSGAVIAIKVNYYDFDGNISGPEDLLFGGPESEFGSTPQPLLLYFVPRPDAAKFSLQFYASNGADIHIALPEVG